MANKEEGRQLVLIHVTLLLSFRVTELNARNSSLSSSSNPRPPPRPAFRARGHRNRQQPGEGIIACPKTPRVMPFAVCYRAMGTGAAVTQACGFLQSLKKKRPQPPSSKSLLTTQSHFPISSSPVQGTGCSSIRPVAISCEVQGEENTAGGGRKRWRLVAT